MFNKSFIALLILTSFSSNFSIMAEPHNRLMMVKSISSEKRSFITRQGRFDGIVEGTELIFKAKNVSFTAKATSVSRFYTQWSIVNSSMTIPITAGEFVVAYKGQEYLWSHHDGSMITQKHREALRPKASWIGGNFYFLRGISESISNVKDDVEVARNGFGLQGDYYREISRKLFWSVGFRVENETIDIKAGTLRTNRLAFLASIYYMTSPIKKFYNARLMTGIGLGFGSSTTASASSSQSGTALILPSIQANFLFEIDKKWSWSAGMGFESLSSKEVIENQSQSTDQLNLKIMVGVHRFFNGLSEY